MGGEKPSRSPRQAPETGSPPRGRGKVFQHGNAAGKIGITPAWAGKSVLGGLDTIVHGDHPRVGGEKFPTNGDSVAKQGSPPRGRGKDVRGIVLNVLGRITPAWAGKRVGPVHKLNNAGDHPRVGGEKINNKLADIVKAGSPPRGRGKGNPYKTYGTLGGITPAWAGKSAFEKRRV